MTMSRCSVLLLVLLLAACENSDSVFDAASATPAGEWELTQTIETTGCKSEHPAGLDPLRLFNPGPISTQVSISVDDNGLLEIRGRLEPALFGDLGRLGIDGDFGGPAPGPPPSGSRSRFRFPSGSGQCPVLFLGPLDGARASSSVRYGSGIGTGIPDPGEPFCTPSLATFTELQFSGDQFFGVTETVTRGCGQVCTTRIDWEAVRCPDCDPLGDCAVQIGDDITIGRP